MSEIKQTFTAADGKTFDTLERAQQHNAFVEALKKFNDAWRELRQTLIDGHRTADGFELTDKNGGWFWDQCYLIRGKYSLAPTILRISLYPSSVKYVTVENDRIEFCVSFYDGRDHYDLHFDLSDLYKKKENADLALVEIYRANIETCKQRIAEIENKTGESQK